MNKFTGDAFSVRSNWFFFSLTCSVFEIKTELFSGGHNVSCGWWTDEHVLRLIVGKKKNVFFCNKNDMKEAL